MSINDQAHEVLALLCARFPKGFFRAYQVRRRPLKLGIHRELVALLGEIERKLLRKALGLHHQPGYLRAQQAGAERIDLDGNPAGVVTEEEARTPATARRNQRQAEAEEEASSRERKQKSMSQSPSPDATGWRRCGRRRPQAAADRRGARHEQAQGVPHVLPGQRPRPRRRQAIVRVDAFRRDRARPALGRRERRRVPRVRQGLRQDQRRAVVLLLLRRAAGSSRAGVEPDAGAAGGRAGAAEGRSGEEAGAGASRSGTTVRPDHQQQHDGRDLLRGRAASRSNGFPTSTA